MRHGGIQERRANWALCASCTSAGHRRAWSGPPAPAATAGWASRRAGRRPHRALAPGDPPAQQIRPAAEADSSQHPVGARRPSLDPVDGPRDHLGRTGARRRRRSPWWGSPSTPTSLTAITPPRRMLGIRSYQRRAVPRAGSRPSAHHTAKDGAIQRFRCGPRVRRRPAPRTGTSTRPGPRGANGQLPRRRSRSSSR